MESDAVAKVLRTVPLFKSLRPNDIARIAGLASVRPYRDGSTIVRQDDTAIPLFDTTRLHAEAAVRLSLTP